MVLVMSWPNVVVDLFEHFVFVLLLHLVRIQDHPDGQDHHKLK